MTGKVIGGISSLVAVLRTSRTVHKIAVQSGMMTPEVISLGQGSKVSWSLFGEQARMGLAQSGLGCDMCTHEREPRDAVNLLPNPHGKIENQGNAHCG